MNAVLPSLTAFYQHHKSWAPVLFAALSLILCAGLYSALPETPLPSTAAPEDAQLTARWARIQNTPTLSDDKIIYLLKKIAIHSGISDILVEKKPAQAPSSSLRVRPFQITVHTVQDAPIFKFLTTLTATLPCAHLADVRITRETTLTADLLRDLSAKKDVSLLKLSVSLEWIETTTSYPQLR